MWKIRLVAEWSWNWSWNYWRLLLAERSLGVLWLHGMLIFLFSNSFFFFFYCWKEILSRITVEATDILYGEPAQPKNYWLETVFNLVSYLQKILFSCVLCVPYSKRIACSVSTFFKNCVLLCKKGNLENLGFSFSNIIACFVL